MASWRVLEVLSVGLHDCSLSDTVEALVHSLVPRHTLLPIPKRNNIVSLLYEQKSFEEEEEINHHSENEGSELWVEGMRLVGGHQLVELLESCFHNA